MTRVGSRARRVRPLRPGSGSLPNIAVELDFNRIYAQAAHEPVELWALSRSHTPRRSAKWPRSPRAAGRRLLRRRAAHGRHATNDAPSVAYAGLEAGWSPPAHSRPRRTRGGPCGG